MGDNTENYGKKYGNRPEKSKKNDEKIRKILRKIDGCNFKIQIQT